MHRRNLLKRFGLWAAASTGIAGYELSQPAHPITVENRPRPNLKQILGLLRAEFPNCSIREQTPATQQNGPVSNVQVVAITSETTEDPVSLASAISTSDAGVATDSISNVVQRAYHQIVETNEVAEPNEGLNRPIQYSLTYCRSKEECRRLPRDELDCNDMANWTCEHLDEHNAPVYTVSTWANEVEDGVAHWHVFAVCKVHDGKFLIVDNASDITIWNGTLASFIAQYRSDDPSAPKVRVVPFGISKYVRPRYNNPLSKILTQFRHAIDGEQSMKTIGAPETRQQRQQTETLRELTLQQKT